MKKRRLWKYARMFAFLLVFTMMISCISTRVYANKPGTGQTEIHIHNVSGVAENKEYFTVTINREQYSAVLTGSVATVEMNTTDNVLGISKDESIEIPFTSSKGSGTMVVSHQEGNGHQEQDEGLNNFKTVSIEFLDPDPGQTPDPDPSQTPDPDPGQTPDPAPGKTPDPDPGQTPDPDPGQTPDPDHGQTPDPDPGKTPDPTPDPTLDPTPDLTPDTEPISDPDPILETDTTPDPEVTPEPTSDPEPQQTITTATEYVPKTGESRAIPFAYGIMGMSATGLAGILVKRKKSR